MLKLKQKRDKWYYFLASVRLIGAMKRNWIVLDTKYDKRMYINID